MAFCIDINAAPIRSYRTALERWASTVPWKDMTGEYDRRPLDYRSKKHMSIRKLNDGSIALRLYSTDLVTYHPDNRISLVLHDNISSWKFMRHFIPACLSTFYESRIGYMIAFWAENEPNVLGIFKINGNMVTLKRVSDGYAFEDERVIGEITKHVINRKKAKDATEKYHVKEFEAWFDAVTMMNPNTFKRENYFWNNADMKALLQSNKPDTEKWMTFMKFVYPHQAKKKYRELVYQSEQVAEQETVKELKSWDELERVRSSNRRNSWAM